MRSSVCSVSEPIRLLGIDPGSRKMGFGLIGWEGGHMRHLESGTLSFGPAGSLRERFFQASRDLRDLIVRLTPSELVLEKAFFGRYPQAALVLGEARGMIMEVAFSLSLKVSEYAARNVKCALTGYGAATKFQVRGMVCRILGIAEEGLGLDASDALALTIAHVFSQKRVFLN